MSSRKIARCVWLIETLRNRRLDYKEINRRWMGSSINDEGKKLPERTLARHIETAEEFFGVVIKCDRRDGYVYYIDEGESIGGSALTDWLISSYSTMNQLAADRSLRGRIIFEDIPSGNNWLTTITEAMRENKVIRITHRGFWKKGASTFDVEPYCLKVFSRRWYLIARNPYYADMYRTYALDRILAVEITNKTFKMKKDFDIEAYFYGCIGVITSPEPAQKVVIRAYGSRPDYLRTLPLHKSQREIASDDKSATFEYWLKPTYDLYQELLAMQDDIEVIEPENIRTRLSTYANNIAAHYKTQILSTED